MARSGRTGITVTKFIGHPSFVRKELETSRILHGLILQLRIEKPNPAATEPKLKSDRMSTDEKVPAPDGTIKRSHKRAFS